MEVNYTGDSYRTLIQLVNFIESTNTEGAGLRWLQRLESFMQKTFTNAAKIKLCHNKTFYKLNLRCIYFNDWVIAFSITENSIQIEALLHKSRISD